MKRILVVLLFLIMPVVVSANADDDIWSYQFHLVYMNGSISPSQETKTSYTPIPAAFIPEADPTSSDYYGNVMGRDGSVLGRFGFMAPQTTDVASGKTKVEPMGPYFAYADKVIFYAKGGKKLFEISVRGSSFCNGNNSCDASSGENYRNCPMDCPAPIELPTPVITTPSPVIATSSTVPSNPNPAIVTPSPSPATDTSSVTVSSGETTVTKKIDTKVVLSFVGGILIIIFAIVLRRVGRNME